MTYTAQDDLGLFEQVDLLPALVMPNNLLPRQEAAFHRGAGTLALTLAQASADERHDRPWDDVRRDGPTYRWSPTVCGPKVDTEATGGCQPYILSVDLRCDHWRVTCQCVGELIYRHLCTCGHVDQAHSDENSAAEDAMDHAWTGWRDLPILASSMPDETSRGHAGSRAPPRRTPGAGSRPAVPSAPHAGAWAHATSPAAPLTAATTWASSSPSSTSATSTSPACTRPTSSTCSPPPDRRPVPMTTRGLNERSIDGWVLWGQVSCRRCRKKLTDSWRLHCHLTFDRCAPHLPTPDHHPVNVGRDDMPLW